MLKTAALLRGKLDALPIFKSWSKNKLVLLLINNAFQLYMNFLFMKKINAS